MQGTAILYNGNGNVKIYNDNSFSSSNNGIIIKNAKTSIVDDCSFTNTNRAIEINNHPTIIKNCDYVNNIPTTNNWFAHLINAMYSKIVNNGPISNISTANSAAIIVRGGLPEIVNNTISGSGIITSKTGLNIWNTSGGYVANNSISNLKNEIRNSPSINLFDNTISNTVHQVNCLNVTLTQGSGYCRNSLFGGINLNFSRNCMNTKLVDNHFLGGTIGLNVNNVIGEQINTGNTWANAFPTFGATNSGNPQASLIVAKTGLPYTPFHNPLGWFQPSLVDPNLSCLGQQITMLKPEEKLVVDGNYI